eukprot:CAMPEP_0176116196 /NCGR_PEP_ID=MMETSP0120_2-20121206/58357_1 /TAXON_ID=160619 /ORGANISM="Kryptoperidinium foliaceum, Strain CCMP 1326" /LENGTH=65 /DNA_ID=CAMNT_0017450447 /DNA_START=118 /DNA_END=313 /DNA_ORIENTATION=-
MACNADDVDSDIDHAWAACARRPHEMMPPPACPSEHGKGLGKRATCDVKGRGSLRAILGNDACAR